MIFPLPKKPDGRTPESLYQQRIWEAVAFLMEENQVAGQKLCRTTRGTFVLPELASTTKAAKAASAFDQAVYVAASETHGAYIAAVRGGYIFKCDASTGSVLSSSRFALPSFSNTSICYDPDHDLLFASFWNIQKAVDYGLYEPIDKRFFKLDPKDFSVISSLNLSEWYYSGPWSDYDPTPYTGVGQLMYYNGLVYGLYQGFNECAYVRINPQTLALVDWVSAPGIDWFLAQTTPWSPITIDTTRGVLWNSAGGEGELWEISLSNFIEYQQDYWSCGSTWTYTNCDVDYGEITMTGSPNQTIYWAGDFPAGGYIILIEGGAVNIGTPDYPQYCLTYGNATYGFSAGFNSTNFAAWLGTYIPMGYTATNPDNGVRSTIEACEALNIGSNNAGQTWAPFASFGVHGWGWGSGAVIAKPIVFRLKRNYDVTPSTLQPFNPYGIAYCPVNDCLYVIVNRSNRIGVFNIAQSYALDTECWSFIDIDEADCFPYNIRFREKDGLIYVPTYRNDKVVTIDPITNTVKDTFDGFDSPFDVMFTSSKAFVVQHGSVGLKEIK